MRPPLRLAQIAVILIVVGIVWAAVIQPAIPEDVLSEAFILGAVPFLSIFIGILLLYIFSIFVAASRLNGVVPQRIHRPIELAIIGGILLGVVGMFQPWVMAGYTYGFLLLLISTLLYIMWSHITPRVESLDT
jgi:hypothetical protein